MIEEESSSCYDPFCHLIVPAVSLKVILSWSLKLLPIKIVFSVVGALLIWFSDSC